LDRNDAANGTRSAILWFSASVHQLVNAKLAEDFLPRRAFSVFCQRVVLE